MTIRKMKVQVDHILKNGLSPSAYYSIKKYVSALINWLCGNQLLMVLNSDNKRFETCLNSQLKIKSYIEINDPTIWIDIVNHSLGDWDEIKAQYSFFNDHVFLPDLCLILYEGYTPVATASCYIKRRFRKRVAELHMVAVKKEYHGKGYGKVISVEVIRRLRRMYEGPIVLRTDDWRIPAIKLYWNIGFRPVSRVGWANHQKRWNKIKSIIYALS